MGAGRVVVPRPAGTMDTARLPSDRGPALEVALPQATLDLIVERVAERVSRMRPPVEPWVGVAEVAAHLGCGRQRVYDLVCRRSASRIPHRKDGARLLFKLSQIDQWVDSGGAA